MPRSRARGFSPLAGPFFVPSAVACFFPHALARFLLVVHSLLWCLSVPSEALTPHGSYRPLFPGSLQSSTICHAFDLRFMPPASDAGFLAGCAAFRPRAALSFSQSVLLVTGMAIPYPVIFLLVCGLSSSWTPPLPRRLLFSTSLYPPPLFRLTSPRHGLLLFASLPLSTPSAALLSCLLLARPFFGCLCSLCFFSPCCAFSVPGFPLPRPCLPLPSLP